jgi:hypothetical protein
MVDADYHHHTYCMVNNPHVPRFYADYHHHLTCTAYRSGAKYRTMVPYLLLFSTIFEVLEGPIHRGNELEMSNCN